MTDRRLLNGTKMVLHIGGEELYEFATKVLAPKTAITPLRTEEREVVQKFGKVGESYIVISGHHMSVTFDGHVEVLPFTFVKKPKDFVDWDGWYAPTTREGLEAFCRQVTGLGEDCFSSPAGFVMVIEAFGRIELFSTSSRVSAENTPFCEGNIGDAHAKQMREEAEAMAGVC